MFLIPKLGLSITLPIIRNGHEQKLTVRKRDVTSVLEYDDDTCHVRIEPHVLPRHYDEHLRVNLPQRKVARMLRWRWR